MLLLGRAAAHQSFGSSTESKADARDGYAITHYVTAQSRIRNWVGSMQGAV